MSDWDETLTPKQKKAWRQFVKHTREDTAKKMASSAFVMSLVPDEVDIKFAVELGLAIMLDKPLMFVLGPGTHIPEHLRRVADKIVVADIDTEEGQAIIQAHVEAFKP